MIIEEMARSHYTFAVQELAHVPEFKLPKAFLVYAFNMQQDRMEVTGSRSVHTFSLSKASLTGLVARATDRDSLESAIVKNLKNDTLVSSPISRFDQHKYVRRIEKGN